MCLNNLFQRCSIHCKNQRSNNWSLWDPTGWCVGWWLDPIDDNRLCARCKICSKPVKCTTSDSKPLWQPLQDGVMTYSVKCRWIVKKNQYYLLALVQRHQNITWNTQECCLTAVGWTIRRLCFCLQMILGHILLDLWNCSSLHRLGHKLEIGNWTIILEIVFI